jgi:hypothetical protein
LLEGFSVSDIQRNANAGLEKWLKRPSSLLKVTKFQQDVFFQLELATIGDVLSASESVFKKARYVGIVRSKQMKNAALTAAMEYLSG